MPIWKFEDFARVIANAKRIIPKANANVSLEVDSKFLYVNNMALPTGPGLTGMIMQCGGTGVSWVTPFFGGETGLPGATGAFGGPPGETGLMGATGIRGMTGAGIQGTTGAQGTTGLRGETGSQGNTGVIGNTGLKGPTGVDFGVTGSISIILNGGVGSLYTGIKGDIFIPYGININSWTVLSTETCGYLNIDIKKTTYGSYPTFTNITLGSTGINIVNGIKNQGNTSSWTGVGLQPGDILRYELSKNSNEIPRVVSFNLGFSRT